MRHIPNMPADPLSDALLAFEVNSFISGDVIAGGQWSIRFPPPEAIKFGAVVRGACWHLVEGLGHATRLQTGDVFVVNGRYPLRLASDLALEPVDAVEAFADEGGATSHLGSGDDVRVLGGHVSLDPTGTELLLQNLPPFIHIAADSKSAAMVSWLLNRLIQEMSQARPGSSAIMRPLAQLLFVSVLRDHAEVETASGWLRAAGDGRIAPAMRLIHDDPARNWRLAELAGACGMSRSSFAARFKAVSGLAPLSYLTFWRMRLAEGALRKGGQSVASLAYSLGYASESAFSNAFKRTVGVAPAHFRGQHLSLK